MSDFDAEAERKRLREKYEAEEESRKQTQQMSELLLKGATMTNRHCGECGSPIFQYEGQEFRPNCQHATGPDAGSEAGTDAEDGAGTDAGSEAGTDAEEPAGADAAAAGSGADAGGAGAAETGSGADPETETTTGGAPSNGVGDTGATVSPGRDHTVGRRVADAPAAGDPATAERPPTAGNEGAAPTRQAARESLLAALTRHAGLAADTDEPRRATDHLAAAREAAAALDELDGS